MLRVNKHHDYAAEKNPDDIQTIATDRRKEFGPLHVQNQTLGTPTKPSFTPQVEALDLTPQKDYTRLKTPFSNAQAKVALLKPLEPEEPLDLTSPLKVSSRKLVHSLGEYSISTPVEIQQPLTSSETTVPFSGTTETKLLQCHPSS